MIHLPTCPAAQALDRGFGPCNCAEADETDKPKHTTRPNPYEGLATRDEIVASADPGAMLHERRKERDKRERERISIDKVTEVARGLIEPAAAAARVEMENSAFARDVQERAAEINAARDASYAPDLPKSIAPHTGPFSAPKQYANFAETAHDLIRYRSAVGDPNLLGVLDDVRIHFGYLIDTLGHVMPQGPDSTIAARKIHDACQACIFAIVHSRVP